MRLSEDPGFEIQEVRVRIRSDGDGHYVGVQGGGDLEPAGGGAGAAVALHPAGAHLPEDQEHPPHQRTVGEYSRHQRLG